MDCCSVNHVVVLRCTNLNPLDHQYLRGQEMWSHKLRLGHTDQSLFWALIGFACPCSGPCISNHSRVLLWWTHLPALRLLRFSYPCAFFGGGWVGRQHDVMQFSVSVSADETVSVKTEPLHIVAGAAFSNIHISCAVFLDCFCNQLFVAGQQKYTNHVNTHTPVVF